MEKSCKTCTYYPCMRINCLFDETKVTYENGTSKNMLFIEAVSLIAKED